MNEEIETRLNAVGASWAEVTEKFIRGSGAGGQKINKTSSTVSLRHEPTGIEVRCQRERSQTANRELAWAELVARLKARAETAKRAVIHMREAERRRTRPKSAGQKNRMIQSKKHRAGIKANRGKGGFE